MVSILIEGKGHLEYKDQAIMKCNISQIEGSLTALGLRFYPEPPIQESGM